MGSAVEPAVPQTAERFGFEGALAQIRFTAAYGAAHQHESASFSQALREMQGRADGMWAASTLDGLVQYNDGFKTRLVLCRVNMHSMCHDSSR